MAQHDTSANLGHWKATLDSVIGGARDPPPTGDVDALNASRKAVLEEAPVEVPETQRERLAGVPQAILDHRAEVKGAFARRKQAGRPAEPGAAGFVKHASPFDDSKLQRMEADMKKRFADKVAMPERLIRPSRLAEQATAEVRSYCRGNELFHKREYAASVHEFAAAEKVPQLRLFARMNRGNAYKALQLFAEAIACFQDALDELPLDTLDARRMHSYALNNLGAAEEDEGRTEQALQHFAAAVALNPQCNLALKNRANLHLTRAEALQRSGDVPALVPPQHELAMGLYAKSMEQDWHLPVVFHVDHDVLVRLDTCITSQNEEPSAHLTRNVTYCFTTNLTHAISAHV